MPLTLTTPEVTTVYSYEITRVDIQLANNVHQVTLVARDANDDTLHTVQRSLPIHDDLGNVISPAEWSTENPTGEEMFNLIREFLFLYLQELPGENGLPEGTIED